MQSACSRGRKKYQIKAIYVFGDSRYFHVLPNDSLQLSPVTEGISGGEL